MSYTKVGPFTNDSASPPIDKSFLDALETFLNTRVVDGNDASANFVPVWNGSAWTYLKLTTSQLADPGSGKVIGSSGGAAAAVNPPGYEFTHDEFTGNVNITATTEGTANTIKTATAVTVDGSTVVMIEFFAPYIDTGGTTVAVNVVLYEDGASIGVWGVIYGTGTTEPQVPVVLKRRRTPASGSRTYSVRAFVNTGTGVVHAGAGGSGNTMPGFIRVTKV